MRRAFKLLNVLGGLFLLLVLGALMLFPWLGAWYAESRYTRPEKLLHDTDHPAVLRACREMLALHRRGELPGQPEPNDPGIPEAVRALRPAYIVVGDDSVQLEMHGGFDHYGFFAYAEGSAKEGRWGGKKLIDGLWFYAEDQ